MTVIHSEDVLLQDIYVNNTSNGGSTSSNTDGANTIYANNITFDRWTVINGDDSIAVKANSTNIQIKDSIFYSGLGVAFGSIGQYKGAYETIENITVNNITCHKTLHGAYIKTWTGEQVGYPPNGGGGGLGCEFCFPSSRGIPGIAHLIASRSEKCLSYGLHTRQPARNSFRDIAVHDLQRRGWELQHVTLWDFRCGIFQCCWYSTIRSHCQYAV
jgi:hypothetical protein